MRYALLDGERIELQKSVKNAICPICKELLIPKCGQIKLHHWAQKNKENCNPWWENETDWHRQWKDNFSKEYQEIIQYDDTTGEKRIADVKTKTGIVIEFQHSYMKPKEQHSRENFYKNMIWVIDARKHYDKFNKNLNKLNHCKISKNYFCTEIDSYEEGQNCFTSKWLNSTVPVIFDFGICSSTNEEYDKQKNGYSAFSQKSVRKSVVKF